MSDGPLPTYDLIQPEKIPGRSIEVKDIHSLADKFNTAAISIREQGVQVETEWGGLAGVYDAPEAPELFMIVKGNRGVGVLTGDLATAYSKASSAISTLAYALTGPVNQLKDLYQDATTFVSTIHGGMIEQSASSSTTGVANYTKDVLWSDDIATKRRNTELIHAVNAEVAKLDEAQAEAVNALNAIDPTVQELFKAPYVPTSLDDLNTPGVPLSWGPSRTPPSCGGENIGNAIGQWFGDSVNSITSLGGYDIYTGKESWDTAGAAWSGLGMTAAGLLLFASPAGWAWQASAAASKAMGQDRPELLKPVDDFVNGAGNQLAGAVGGFTQWDTWRTDPGKAATNVILNVGSLAIPAGGAGAAAKALAGAKVGALVEKFIDVGSKIRGPAGEAISGGLRAGANGVGDALKVLEAARQAPAALAREMAAAVKPHLPVWQPSIAGVGDGVTHMTGDGGVGTASGVGHAGGSGGSSGTHGTSPSDGYDPRNYNSDGTIKEGKYGELSPERRQELLDQQAAHDAQMAGSTPGEHQSDPAVGHDSGHDEAGHAGSDGAAGTGPDHAGTNGGASNHGPDRTVEDALPWNPTSEVLDPNRTYTNIEKSEFGEAQSDAYMRAKGYERIDIPHTNVSHNGIDAIYRSPDGHFVIVEAKFGTAGLKGGALDGRQMSEPWLTGGGAGGIDRISNAVQGNKELADAIKGALERNDVTLVMTKIDRFGVVTPRLLNYGGYVVRGATPKL